MPSVIPENLVFKNGKAFLEYACKYMHTEIEPNVGLVALVLDSQKEFGASQAIKIETDGSQLATLRVASTDGGFVVASKTATVKGDRLKPDDVVLWVPQIQPKELTASFQDKGMDPRFGWIGLIVAKIAPELNINSNRPNILCDYV